MLGCHLVLPLSPSWLRDGAGLMSALGMVSDERRQVHVGAAPSASLWLGRDVSQTETHLLFMRFGRTALAQLCASICAQEFTQIFELSG